jgi:hypothetical protein
MIVKAEVNINSCTSIVDLCDSKTDKWILDNSVMFAILNYSIFNLFFYKYISITFSQRDGTLFHAQEVSNDSAIYEN